MLLPLFTDAGERENTIGVILSIVLMSLLVWHTVLYFQHKACFVLVNNNTVNYYSISQAAGSKTLTHSVVSSSWFEDLTHSVVFAYHIMHIIVLCLRQLCIFNTPDAIWQGC